ncbi:MAG: cytochrome c [Candidatus Eremiobacteraeota bacterium]|nr:cytochrome c [Candidatus Eremiobacteraeota bacterium]
MIRNMVAGGLVTLALAAIVALLAVRFGLVPANADAKPSSLERWAAGTSLRATVARDAPKQPDPLALNDANLEAGIKLYADNCMVCHGASDGQGSNIALGLYQHAPQFGKHGVEDDPEGETYWKIDHGIRLTGMPSFARALDDEQIWQLAMFLKHMDSLPAAAQAAWKKLPSQSGSAGRKGPPSAARTSALWKPGRDPISSTSRSAPK